jgi:hypothetical protein
MFGLKQPEIVVKNPFWGNTIQSLLAIFLPLSIRILSLTQKKLFNVLWYCNCRERPIVSI